MPLSKTNELNLIMNENAKLTVEHSGGDGWTLLHGDTLSIVRAFKPGVFDAVITDPPYASGGAKPSEKNRTTTQKYSSMRADKALPDFDGDQKDQRSWTRWMAEWLSDVRNVPFPVSWTVKMKKKQKETQDILSYHTQAAGCSDKARAKASGGRQPIEECGRTGL